MAQMDLAGVRVLAQRWHCCVLVRTALRGTGLRVSAFWVWHGYWVLLLLLQVLQDLPTWVGLGLVLHGQFVQDMLNLRVALPWGMYVADG